MTAYPFSAVVGLDDLRLALVVNAVSPAVGGVLVRGEKGTAKSTVVRALAALLPPLEVVDGCRFSCDPHGPDPLCPDGPHAPTQGVASRPARLVELPVGASEDRLTGSLDLERALTSGVATYEPGLLASAHRGVLYVDEVNLLHDHLVDLLLDAAALGTCYVEREGVSVRHQARFLLVGTMNPEEGELRPQLLDRFGLTVEITATRDPAERAEVVRRRLDYESDPDGFAARYLAEDAELAARILAARGRLGSVRLGDRALREVTTVCAAFDVDGLRADIVTAKAAVALAAWAGRSEVSTEDVRTAARLALPHRRRRTPFEAPGLDEQQLDDALSSVPPEAPGDGPRGEGSLGEGSLGDGPVGGNDPGDDHPDDDGPGTGRAPADPAEDGAPSGAGSGEGQQAATALFRPVALAVDGVNRRDGAAGRRSRARTATAGRDVGARLPAGRLQSLHLSATLRAAAPHQRSRGRSGPGLLLRPADLRQSVREGREGNLVVFVVDASGSMAARQRMGAVKGAALSLLTDAYQRRDKVAVVTFRGDRAELVLPPTTSVDAAARLLTGLPTGGRTPLHAALVRLGALLDVEAVRDPSRRGLVVLVTDGRHTQGPAPDHVAAVLSARPVTFVVVDCESGPVRLGLAGRLGHLLGGRTVALEELSAEGLHAVVSGHRRVA